MFVVYSNGDKVLVTTRKNEQEATKEIFGTCGHDQDEYERVEIYGPFVFVDRGELEFSGKDTDNG